VALRSPQAVIFIGGRHDGAEHIRVLVHGANQRGAEDQELHVLVRSIARLKQVTLRAVAERPVQVLARTVDAGERLLVQQALHAVLLGHLLERQHD
jgi:hypothetical protein